MVGKFVVGTVNCTGSPPSIDTFHKLSLPEFIDA
jgi:hypothetical protein